MFWKALVAALFIAGVFGEYQISEENKEKLKNKLKEQCEKVNAPEDAPKEIATAVQNFMTCVTDIVNFKDVKDEIEKAKPQGALDEVFKKYCAKTPEIKTCIHTLFDAFVPCLDDIAKSHLNAAKNGTDQLIDFVCYKDGDRIALFISEKGPECFGSMMEPIRGCTTTLQNAVNAQIDQSEAVTETLVDKCGKFDNLSKCVVTALEGCDNPTPSNMAEALFKFVRKGSPCNEALPKQN